MALVVVDDDFPVPLTFVVVVCLAAAVFVVDTVEVGFAEVPVTFAATDVTAWLTDEITDFAPTDATDSADWASMDLMENSLKTGSAIIKSSWRWVDHLNESMENERNAVRGRATESGALFRPL